MKLAPGIGRSLIDLGNCLTGGPRAVDDLLRMRKPRINKDLPCENTYDQALLLFRYPLDNIRSNYHYRTKVLKMRGNGTWSQDDYAFPRERGEAWVKFYRAWERFAEVKPAIRVLYEDLKKHTARELRRIVDFLAQGLDSVTQARLECAVEASTMENLKTTDRLPKGFSGNFSDQFFGSRLKTEEKETLSFPVHLITYFREIGMFEIARQLGYEKRDEEEPVHDLPEQGRRGTEEEEL